MSGNALSIPDPLFPDTKLRGQYRAARERRRQDLIDKGWKFDDLWWHSPYTGIRYDFTTACDVEYLREEWKNPLALDWDKFSEWSNQWGSGGQSQWKGEPVW